MKFRKLKYFPFAIALNGLWQTIEVGPDLTEPSISNVHILCGTDHPPRWHSCANNVMTTNPLQTEFP
jgi:hypothetical protein